MSSPDLAQVVLQTYGAFLLGSLTATFLSGMNTLQTILYFRLYPEDSLTTKASVSVVWSVDIIHTAFIWVSLWNYFIENIGQITAIDTIQTPELIPGATVATTIVTLIVQLFYIHRIFCLSHRKLWICGPILFFSIARVASSMATTGELYRAKTFSGFGASPFAWILSLGLVFAAAADVAIMAAMAVLLKLNRQKSMSLNNVIDRLILYTLEMGSVTAITAVVSAIAWFAMPHTLIFMGVYLPLAKLYAISLMGSLNTRYNLRHDHDSQNSHAWKLSRGSRVPISQASNPVASTEVQLQQVHIDVTNSIEYEDKAARSF